MIILTTANLYRDCTLHLTITTLTYDSINYSTSANSTVEGYVGRGTTTEDTLDWQHAVAPKTGDMFYGNTQYVVFYPTVNTQNNTFDKFDYNLRYADSYMSKLTFEQAGVDSVYYSLEYGVDTATEYQIDFRNFTLKNSAGTVQTAFTANEYSTFEVLSQKTADTNLSITFNVQKAYNHQLLQNLLQKLFDDI